MERKLATAMFVDLVDSTALVSGSDPEIVRRRVTGFFDRVAGHIAAYGGTVEKFAGDAVVAVFGALLGVVIGLVFGVAITTAMPDDFVSVIDIPFGQLIALMVLAAILGVVAAIWPAVRASRLDVLHAIAFE